MDCNHCCNLERLIFPNYCFPPSKLHTNALKHTCLTLIQGKANSERNMPSNLVIYENIPLHNVQDYPTICYGVANPGEEQSCYGNVLIRSVAAFGLVRKWQSCFWLYVHPASLVIFRSSYDHERWLASGGGDISTRRKSREILLHIDFDTLGILEGSQSGTKVPCRESLRLNSKTTSPAKLLSKLQKYALGDVRTKCSGNSVM
jgi:hypothetical protein